MFSGSQDTRDAAPAELANRLFFRLYQSSNLMHKTGTRALEDFGVTTQQWAVIGALSRPQAVSGMSINELAEFLQVSRQNLAGVVSRLEAQGYVTRTRDPVDGRSRRLALSAEGKVLWHDIVPAIYAYYERALTGFDVGARASLLSGLERLLGNLKDL